jgi:hypothetical protein
VIAYLTAVAFIEVLRHAEVVTATDFAATPDAIADFKLWRLVTSAFVVSGPPVLELLGLTAATVLFLRRYSPATFWAVAFAGHVGGTLLAYAGIGALWLTSRETVQSVVDQPDYGVSAVWLAVLGALLADSLGSVRSGTADLMDRVLTAACLLAAAIGFVFFPVLGGTEHLLAFLAGYVVATLMRPGPLSASHHS